MLVERLRSELLKICLLMVMILPLKSGLQNPIHSYDILLCLDVLEHVEVNTINSVIEDISSMTSIFVTLLLIFSQLL